MIVAVMLAKNEADIVGYTVEHLLNENVDHVIVADNLSTDATRQTLENAGSHVTVLDDPEPGHYQGAKTSRLAHMAWGMGADWVVPCDADELFYARQGTLGDWFGSCEASIVDVQVFDHIVTDDDNPMVRNPWLRVTYRRQYPQRLAKVAFRASPHVEVAEGNHDVRGVSGERTTGLFARHVQYRSFEQMVRKVRDGAEAMDAAGMHPLHGTHWRDAARLSDDELHRQWRRLCEEPGLIEDPAPW